MKNNKNLIYILLIILVIVIYIYQRDDTKNLEMSAIDLSTQPIYQSEQMSTMIYDLSGNLSYEIIAENVKHFDNSNETLFRLPIITLYNQDNVAIWHIQAKNATLTSNKLLILNDHVQLLNLTQNAQLEKILTENAKVNLLTQIVTSENKVTIQGPNYTSTGTGLLGDLREKTANILEDVKTYYNTQATETNSSTN